MSVWPTVQEYHAWGVFNKNDRNRLVAWILQLASKLSNISNLSLKSKMLADETIN